MHFTIIFVLSKCVLCALKAEDTDSYVDVMKSVDWNENPEQ